MPVKRIGLIGLVIGVMDGYYRSVVHFQRNELARELALDEEFRSELEAQNQRLRELEAAKRRSTRFLVHDLKTHLGCVLGFSELLLKQATAEQRRSDREVLERILRQARQMLGAVLDLLDLARMEEAPELDLDLEDVQSMLDEALASVDAPGADGRVQIGERHPQCPPGWCDRRLIVRVLVNLVANSLKHNPQGVSVIIDATPAEGEVILSCHDDGPGIPAELVPKIFDEFVTESEQTRGYASGLGLAFCRTAVESHGGRIWCDSGRGQGTTFQFTLPIGPEGAPRSVRPHLEAESRCIVHDKPQKGDVDMGETANALASVLVVEDEEDYAALLAAVLRDQGYQVRVAYDGIEAVEKVQEQIPDLILLDIQMPRKTGILFFREMRSKPTLRDVPVVVVTGLTVGDPDMEMIIHSFLDVEHLARPDAYLQKPVEMEQLLEVVARTIRTGVEGEATQPCTY